MAFIYTLSYRRLAVQIKLLLLRRGRLSERGKVARGGIVVRLALMTHRTPRASCIMLLVHGILAVHMLICFSITSEGDNAPLAPASRHGKNPVPRGVSPRVMDLTQSFVRGLLTTDNSCSHPWNFCNFSPFCSAGRRQEVNEQRQGWSKNHALGVHTEVLLKLPRSGDREDV